MIDRRIFLQLTGGVAVGAAGLADSASAGAGTARSPVVESAPSLVHVGDGVVSPLADPLRLLSERLALASDGRLALERAPASANEAPSAAAGRLILASEEEFAEDEPTSLLLGGYPFGVGAADLEITTWLRGAGGQALWDMAAARCDWRPLMVGELGGADAQVWSRVPLETQRDLAGLRIAAPRAVHEPLKASGATPLAAGASDVLPAFAAGEIDAFETDDPALSLAATEQLGDSAHWYTGSIAGTSRILSLRLPLAQWQSLSAADQALAEAVAQETAATLQAVRRTNERVLVGQIARARRQRPRAFSTIIRNRLGIEAPGLLPQTVCEEPVFASMLATMTALVVAPVGLGDIDWRRPSV